MELAKRHGNESSLSERQLNPPSLDLGLQFYWDVFWKLGADRAIGMAEGPIPWTAVHTYATSCGMDREETDRLYAIVRSMDKVYLETSAKKRDAAMKSKQAASSSRNSGKFIAPKH